jgi:hypothetical protein
MWILTLSIFLSIVILNLIHLHIFIENLFRLSVLAVEGIMLLRGPKLVIELVSLWVEFLIAHNSIIFVFLFTKIQRGDLIIYEILLIEINSSLSLVNFNQSYIWIIFLSTLQISMIFKISVAWQILRIDIHFWWSVSKHKYILIHISVYNFN